MSFFHSNHQQATVKLPNIIAREKGFKFHAQSKTGAYYCSEFKGLTRSVFKIPTSSEKTLKQ